MYKFIWENCILSYTRHCNICIKLCAEPCNFKALHHIPQAKKYILPLRSKHYFMLIKTINMLINNFRALWAKPSRMLASFLSSSNTNIYNGVLRFSAVGFPKATATPEGWPWWGEAGAAPCWAQLAPWVPLW